MPGCWDSASNTGRTADGRPAARIAGRRGDRRAERWGCHGLPSTVVRPARKPGISSPVLRPPGPCVRPNARTSSTCSPARASSTGHRPRSSRRCSMKAGVRRAHDVPDPGREPAGARAEQSAAVIPATLRELVATGPNQYLVLGHHPAPYAQTLDVLLRSMSCSTSCSRYVVGWMVERSGERRARRDADRGNLSQARHRAPACSPCIRTVRCADDQQVHSAQLLADHRGSLRSLSRPQVSDDNPYQSEAQFKTLKYHPRLPWPLRRHYTPTIAFCR